LPAIGNTLNSNIDVQKMYFMLWILNKSETVSARVQEKSIKK
jgi:hypothetical protein